MELLEYDEFCTSTGQVGNTVSQAFNVVLDVSRVMLLKETYFHNKRHLFGEISIQDVEGKLHGAAME